MIHCCHLVAEGDPAVTWTAEKQRTHFNHYLTGDPLDLITLIEYTLELQRRQAAVIDLSIHDMCRPCTELFHVQVFHLHRAFSLDPL